jgi:hypothetical protein
MAARHQCVVGRQADLAAAEGLADAMRSAAISNATSLATSAGDLPPSSSVTGVRCCAAARMM